MECEQCGNDDAIWIIKRVVHILNEQTGILEIHPDDTYEEDLMTDILCTKCAKDCGFIE